MLRGFDVSHWQGSVDWQHLKNSYGIAFGAIKATEGNNFVDNQFASNKAKLKNAGLVRKFYHFARPGTSVLGNADHFIDTVGTLDPTDILVLDLETGDGKTQEFVNDWAKTWALRVRSRRPDFIPNIYMGSGYLTNRTGIGLNDPDKYYGSLWYPRPILTGQSWPTVYAPPPPRNSAGNSVPWSECAWHKLPDFWQFSWTVDTPDKDANVFNGTLAQLKSLNEGASMALTDADVHKNWSQDGEIDPPDSLTTPTNPKWAPASALKELLVGRVHLENSSKVLTTKVNTLQTDVTALKAAVAAIPGGPLDIEAIATAVADKLSQRLQQ